MPRGSTMYLSYFAMLCYVVGNTFMHSFIQKSFIHVYFFIIFQELCMPSPIPFADSKTMNDLGCTRGICVVENWKKESGVGDTYSQWQFWLFTLLLVFAWGGTSVVTTMSDTICIEICKYLPTYYYFGYSLAGRTRSIILSISVGFSIILNVCASSIDKNIDDFSASR